jgi:hypothetical protein
MFAEPNARSLTRAGEDELGTCLRSPQEIHHDLQQLEIVMDPRAAASAQAFHRSR